MIVTNDDELYHILLSLRAHGWTRNLPKINLVTGTKSDNEFEESYRFVLPGYNVRPLELSGAIGIEQIKKIPSFIQARRSNAQLFIELMKKFQWVHIQKEIGKSSWFGFSLVLAKDAPISRGQLVQNLMDAKIDCRPIVAGNFTKNDVIQWFDYEVFGEMTNAKYIDENGIFIGNHHYKLDVEFDQLRNVLSQIK